MFTQETLEAFGKSIVDNFELWSKTHNNSYNSGKVSIEYEFGKKYVRVIRNDGSSRSVHSFVEISNGDVWKAASWKTPAKNHPRGNISNITENISCWTGAK